MPSYILCPLADVIDLLLRKSVGPCLHCHSTVPLCSSTIIYRHFAGVKAAIFFGDAFGESSTPGHIESFAQ